MIRTVTYSILGGALAAALVWVTLSLIGLAVTDHQRLNALWDLEVRRAQAQQGPPAAAPPPPAPAK